MLLSQPDYISVLSLSLSLSLQGVDQLSLQSHSVSHLVTFTQETGPFTQWTKGETLSHVNTYTGAQYQQHEERERTEELSGEETNKSQWRHIFEKVERERRKEGPRKRGSYTQRERESKKAVAELIGSK